jgi:anti-sigma factor RsiW
MITCRDLAESLADFVDGALSEEHHRRVEKHLTECPSCLVYVSTYRLTIQLSQTLPRDHPLPPPCEQRLRDALRRHGYA